MLQTICIGYLGADADVKSDNGKEFTTLRVAHSERWQSANGEKHEETTWVDCVISGKPAVVDYLKKGQMVFVSGTTKLRCYSSAKDRCFKAGLTINVRSIELLGGKSDDIPSMLFSAIDGGEVKVTKHFYAQSLVRTEDKEEFIPLLSKSQERFVCDRNGWVTPFEGEE